MTTTYYIADYSNGCHQVLGETDNKEQALRIYEYFKESSTHITLWEDTLRSINLIREDKRNED